MMDQLHNAERLFTAEEAVTYLPECQAYTEAEFGAGDAFPVDYLTKHRMEGVQFYQPYGDFSALPPKVLGLASCMFISYAMYDDMLEGRRKETELDPWRPEDGKAIFWVAAVVSEKPGIFAKCLSAIFDQAEAHEFKNRVDRVGVVCTGPQGYLMARSFGLVESGTRYKNGWLFMDRKLGPGGFRELSTHLQDIWGMTRVRDCIREGRAMWGEDWKKRDFTSSKPGKTQED